MRQSLSAQTTPAHELFKVLILITPPKKARQFNALILQAISCHFSADLPTCDKNFGIKKK